MLQPCEEHALQRRSAGSGAACVEAAIASNTTPTKAACGTQGCCGSAVQQLLPYGSNTERPSLSCTRLHADTSSTGTGGHHVGTASSCWSRLQADDSGRRRQSAVGRARAGFLQVGAGGCECCQSQFVACLAVCGLCSLCRARRQPCRTWRFGELVAS